MENMKVFVRMVKRESTYLKMKFSSILERVNLPEVNIEWREIGECFLLIILSLVLYVSVVFTQFAFVPIMIITIKRGWKEAVIYLTLASILLLYMMANAAYRIPFDSGLLLFSPTHFAFEFIGSIFGIKGGRFLDNYFVFGILGIFLGYLILKNYKLNYVIFFSLCVYVGIIIFTLSLTGLFGSYENLISDYSQFVDNKTSSYLNLSLTQIGHYRTVLQSRGIDYSFLEKKLEIAAEIYKRSVIFGIAPRGGYLIKQIIIIFNLQLSSS